MISNNLNKWIYKYKNTDSELVNVFVNTAIDKKSLITETHLEKYESIYESNIVYLLNPFDTSWIHFASNVGAKYACIWFNIMYYKDTHLNHLIEKEIQRLDNIPAGWMCSGIFDTIETIPVFKEKLILLNISEWKKYQPEPMFTYNMVNVNWKFDTNVLGRIVRFTGTGEKIQTPIDLQKNFYGSKWINFSLKYTRKPTWELSKNFLEYLNDIGNKNEKNAK